MEAQREGDKDRLLTALFIDHYDPLRRAFSNILRNAVEATPAGGRVTASGGRAGEVCTGACAYVRPGAAVVIPAAGCNIAGPP